MVGHVAVAWDVVATKAAAGALVTSTSGGGCTMRDQYTGGEGTNTEGNPSALEFSECSESGVFRVLGVFVFLCPDINFMSAILGQNTKYVF